MKTTIGFTVDSKSRKQRGLFHNIFRSQHIIENPIDFDISLMLLDAHSQLISMDGFVFYNNISFGSDIIKLRLDDNSANSHYDEEVTIDFERIPSNIKSILFFISNHQKFNFGIFKADISMIGFPFDTSGTKQFTISNENVGNALELFRLSRIHESSSWVVEIVNLPVFNPNGMEYILNKYMSTKFTDSSL